MQYMGLTRNQKHMKRELINWKIEKIKGIFENKDKRKNMQKRV